MSKKFGKFLLFSAVAGAAAYGAYRYLSDKEKTTALNGNDDDDDFDDFSEDLDEETTPQKDRSYVSLNLDKAEAFATEAFQKAKEVITDSVQRVKETVMDAGSDRTIIDVTEQTAPFKEADTAASDTTGEDAAQDTDSASEEADTTASADTATADEAAKEEAADDAVSGTTDSPITEEFPFE